MIYGTGCVDVWVFTIDALSATQPDTSCHKSHKALLAFFKVTIIMLLHYCIFYCIFIDISITWRGFNFLTVNIFSYKHFVFSHGCMPLTIRLKLLYTSIM